MGKFQIVTIPTADKDAKQRNSHSVAVEGVKWNNHFGRMPCSSLQNETNSLHTIY